MEFWDWGLEIGDWRLEIDRFKEGVKILLGFVGGLRDSKKGGMGKGLAGLEKDMDMEFDYGFWIFKLGLRRVLVFAGFADSPGRLFEKGYVGKDFGQGCYSCRMFKLNNRTLIKKHSSNYPTLQLKFSIYPIHFHIQISRRNLYFINFC